jgi:putative ABC transport system permease protein
MRHWTASVHTGEVEKASAHGARVFVIAEVALSLTLLVGAGLLAQSLFRLSSTPLGFEPANLLTANIDLPILTDSDPERRLAFYEGLKNHVASLAGVQAVAFGPLGGGQLDALSIEGRPGPYGQSLQNAVNIAAVDADYFSVMKIPLLQGREFDTRDQRSTLPVAIVNEALVKRFLNGNPIGQHIKLGPRKSGGWLTIVGVVGDVKGFTVFKEMGYVTDPFAYRPLPQMTDARDAIFVRSTLNSSSLVPAIRDVFSRLDANLPPPDLTTMHDWLSQFYAQPRLRAVLLSIFAALGLLLCTIGIFGVLSQSVTQQRHEIGIRMALGAQPQDVLRSVLWQGGKMAAAGVLLGLAVSFGLTRLLATMLFGVSAYDPLTFAAIASLLVAVALAACYLPARRAMRVDPMVALRHE